MPEKKTDRRTLKTRKALCEALAELLMEKELHKITVQEIADKADVNRVTFYKHYMDVYDLYENRMIVCPNTTWQLKSKIDKLLSGLFLKMQSEKQSADINDHVVSYQAYYRSHGCMSVIFKWVADNFSEPKDFIIKVLSELDRNTEKFIVNKM